MVGRLFRALTLVLCVLPGLANSDDVIDIVVLFSSDTSLSSFEKLTTTNTLQGLANAAAFNSTRNLSFSFVPLVTSVSYNASQKTSTQAVEWHRDKNALHLLSEVSLARENLVAGGADIVLMVVDKFSNGSCGIAFTAPTSININKSETHAFAAFALNEPNCDRPDISLPHELGHVLI